MREARVELTTAAWQTLRAHAARAVPEECCGLLIGLCGRIEQAWPAQNVASRPTARYTIEPADHFAAIRHARASALAVLGAYHSHPGSAPTPSDADIREAVAGLIYVIVGRTTADDWTARAFEAADGNFEPRALVFVA